MLLVLVVQLVHAVLALPLALFVPEMPSAYGASGGGAGVASSEWC